MKKRYYLLLLGLLLLCIAYITYSDSLPPRTPLKIARLISGLEISNGVEFKMLQDEWSPNGDGIAHIKATLTDKELNDYSKQSTLRGYKRLPIKESSPNLILPDGVNDRMNGYYLLNQDKEDPRDYTFTIIDSQKKEMIVFINYM
ncbi:hypothetical protein [Rufibacter roseus]|uniref:Uncharacterized protein n=1 Tax=Rufibacter roseus TaxID=1567108 RepID=A0ABW2DN43_9BACT|nr:hypothetical protein [Rufibacter roseus]